MRGFLVFIWEQWRQTYKGLAAVFAALVVFGLGAWKFTDLLLYVFSKSVALVVGSAYLPTLGAIALLFLQESRGRIGFAYPRRMLVLPAHTFTLVAAPLVYRLAVVAAFGYATGWLNDTFLKDLYFAGPQVLTLMYLTAAIHAFVFLTCGYGASTGTALFAGAFAVGFPGLLYLYRNVNTNMSIPSEILSDYIPPDLGYGGVPVAVALIAYWAVVAYLGARYARSEVAEDPVGGMVRVATRITYFDRDRSEFASPEAAQQWLEWRRGAYLFPWISLALGILLVLTLQMPGEKMLDRFLVSFNVLVIAPAVIASLVGYLLTRGGNDYQWFVGARPLSTATIAQARLRAGIKAMIWAYVLLGLLFVITFKVKFPHDPMLASLVEGLRSITSTDGPFGEGVVLLLFVSMVAVLTSWSLLWLARSAGAVVWIAFAVVSVWFYSSGAVYQYNPETKQFESPTTPFIFAMAACLGIAGACAIATAVWRGYIRPVTLIAVLAVWAAIALAGYRMSFAIDLGGPWVLAACALLPLVPLASIPLTLEWQRHR
ncbi:MAG: hypothetical protein FJY92_11145 [Candidatus Hydrogenedentes bacterium]|nr:hypothetical protein [Candidatus Hydrogenedentota bacterium]